MSVTPPMQVGYPDLNLDVQVLKEKSLANNPWLQVRQAKIGQSEVEVKLAKKEYWPDMDFKVAYGQRDDDPTGGNRPDFVS
ncbi:MAG: TolC family protein, partial [Gammaproteobacteria bacterium]|nr:TolC family protein [Gammaproteobacteria bacterium]